MSRSTLLALLPLVITLGASPAASCAGANPAIVSAAVKNATQGDASRRWQPAHRIVFNYDYHCSHDAGAGSTHLRFQIEMRHPSPPGSQDCNPSNGAFTLTL